MPFSGKANDIHNFIVSHGKTISWVGVAKNFVKKKHWYRPGPDWIRDRTGLVETLKTALSDQISDANDDHWGEIADWLFGLAIPK